ncbi:hypothetical protein Pedsa_1610 [Pseudopedobacter saltans DSM 12145]|uniref:Uncharacterized protein n=1 Tax=Pseudopedobacter saltans (strain ATCC 51119 / DSM 12145 / JCM 21818 / CCUG 39354 / LMG 10337 / NBRC 100064 / NCIMB 13643) TaxID=762903 RepID=F0S6Q9_PSESL|nr:hypothetical protein Pedsa_1610 [Pseudopedobacter saltans DSM 12145]
MQSALSYNHFYKDHCKFVLPLIVRTRHYKIWMQNRINLYAQTIIRHCQAIQCVAKASRSNNIHTYPDCANERFIQMERQSLYATALWFFPAAGKELGQPPAMRRTDIHASHRHSTNIIDADILFFFRKKNQKTFSFYGLALALRSEKNDIAPTFLCYPAF